MSYSTYYAEFRNGEYAGRFERYFCRNAIVAGAERLLTLETINENKANSKSKQQLNQLKKDVQAITEAIASYKEQISKLEGKNKSQSASLKG